MKKLILILALVGSIAVAMQPNQSSSSSSSSSSEEDNPLNAIINNVIQTLLTPPSSRIRMPISQGDNLLLMPAYRRYRFGEDAFYGDLSASSLVQQQQTAQQLFATQIVARNRSKSSSRTN